MHSTTKGQSSIFQQKSKTFIIPPSNLSPFPPAPHYYPGDPKRGLRAVLSISEKSKEKLSILFRLLRFLCFCLMSHQLSVVGLDVLWEIEFTDKGYLSGRLKSLEALKSTPESYRAVKG